MYHTSLVFKIQSEFGWILSLPQLYNLAWELKEYIDVGLVSPVAENIIYKSKLIMELSFILICPTTFRISYLNSYIMEPSET